jgi:hypothetical protein
MKLNCGKNLYNFTSFQPKAVSNFRIAQVLGLEAGLNYLILWRR